MNYTKHVEYFFLTVVCAIAGLGVSSVAKMGDNINQITISNKELSVRIELANEKIGRCEQDIKDMQRQARFMEMRARR